MKGSCSCYLTVPREVGLTMISLNLMKRFKELAKWHTSLHPYPCEVTTQVNHVTSGYVVRRETRHYMTLEVLP